VYNCDIIIIVVFRCFFLIFGEVGRVAFEEVIIQLIFKKWMPILINRLQDCSLNKFDIISLDFVVNRFF